MVDIHKMLDRSWEDCLRHRGMLNLDKILDMLLLMAAPEVQAEQG